MYLAIRVRQTPFLFKLVIYLVLTWLATRSGWGQLLLLSVIVPIIASLHPLPLIKWLSHGSRFWPIAGLPILAWLVVGLAGGDFSDWQQALEQSLRYWLLFLLSDLFSHLVGPREVRQALAFWPELGVTVTLFLTFLAWLRQELEVLQEAALLRKPVGPVWTLRLRAQILFNLLVRGMEQAKDKGDALYLRTPNLT